MTAEQLRKLLGLVEPWEQRAAEATVERDAARAREAAATHKLDASLARLAERDERIECLRDELHAARQENASLRDQLRDAGSAGRSDVSSVRARSLSAMQGRLRPILEMAREACEAEPIRERVVRRMVLDALLEIDKEIRWLTSSD